MLFSLHLSKSCQKWAQKIHFPSNKKINYNKFFVNISENRVYCNSKPSNYQIWCVLVFITTFVCVHLPQKQEEKNAFCRIFFSFFPRLLKMQCSSIVNKKLEYYSCFDYFHCCKISLLWFVVLWFALQSYLNVVVEMDQKNDPLREVIDFLINGEDSWNADSDEKEEEIVTLLPIERAEAKLIATVISQMTKT